MELGLDEIDLDQILEHSFEVLKFAIVKRINTSFGLLLIQPIAPFHATTKLTGNLHLVSQRASMPSWCFALEPKASPNIHSPDGASFMAYVYQSLKNYHKQEIFTRLRNPTCVPIQIHFDIQE